MAHGFLSYQDNIGESAIERKITKLIEDKLEDFGNKVVRSINRRIHNSFAKKEAKQAVEAAKQSDIETRAEERGGALSLFSGSALSNISKRSAASASSVGSTAVTPDVLGGALSRISRKPGLGDSPNIVDTTATAVSDPAALQGIGQLIVASNNNVVQALMGIQQVNVRVVDSIENLGRLQTAIAARQEQQQRVLAGRASAADEARLIRAGQDLSGGITADPAGDGPQKGGGFVQMPGIGSLGRALVRGGGRSGGKIAGKTGAKIGAKALGKGLLKKVPLLGLGAGLLFAGERAMAGDFTGAGLELASGAASTVPGFGTAGSIGIDAALAARDLAGMETGGITTKERIVKTSEGNKPEGWFPLGGTKGKQTFRMFGEGILEAQTRNKRESAKIMALGLEEYYDKRNGWEKFLDALGSFIKSTPLGKFFKWGGKNNDNENRPPGSPLPPGSANDLFSLISGGEGGIDSYNTGTAGSQAGYKPPIPISQMTVDQVKGEQDKGKLFAVGKYQIIPKTMNGFIRYLKSKGIDTSTTKFDENLQNMFADYTLESKRAKVGKFIKGEKFDNYKDYTPLETAQLELAAEFASVGVPRDMKAGEYADGVPKVDIKKGDSLYTGVGGNAASITPDAIAAQLTKAKERGTAAPPPKSTPEFEDPLGPPPPPSWTEGIEAPSGIPVNSSAGLKLKDNIFARRVKEGDDPPRWKIIRRTFLGGEGEINTTGTENESFKPLLLDAIERYKKATGNQASAALSAPEVKTAAAEQSQANALNKEVASASTGATYNYFTTGASTASQSAAAADVAFGASLDSVGTGVLRPAEFWRNA